MVEGIRDTLDQVNSVSDGIDKTSGSGKMLMDSGIRANRTYWG